MGNAAKQANIWSEWGGRNSMAQHLSDEQQLLQYKTLLNRQDWLLFTSPQQAYSWRQQELQQRRQMNYAQWADYTSPDQYLAFVQRQISTTKLMNDQIFAQATAYRANADAASRYATALAGIHGPEGGLKGLQSMEAALAGIPASVTTVLSVDDTAALAAIAAYQASLGNIPDVVTTTFVAAQAGPGGAPGPGSGATGTPEVIPVSYGGPYQHQFAAIMSEVAELAKLRVQIPVHFELPSAAEVAAFVSQIPTAGITEPVHLAPQGGAVGVGAGPPPEVIAAWKALSGAESGAVTESKLAAAAESAAGAAAAGAVPKVAAATAAWEALGGAEKAAAAEGMAAGQAAAAADEAAWQARIDRVGAYYDALVKADAEALHTARDFVPPPAAAQAWEQLTLGVDGFSKAVDAAAAAAGWQQLSLDTEVLGKDTAAWTALAGVEDKATAAAARFVASAKEIRDLSVSTALVPYVPPTAAGGAGGTGKPPAPPPAAAAAAAEPPSDAAAKWAALSAAEKAAGTEAALDAVKFAALKAAADGDASAASHLAYVYQTLGGDTKDAGDKATGAAAGFGAFSRSLATFAGFGTKLALFGGLAGTVGVVHLLVDAIIELIAITVLAAVGIAAVAASVAIFIGVATQAQDTIGRISDRLKATQVAAQATGQAIYPLGQNFDSLASKIRPQVWQLYGDALNLVSGRAGALGQIALKTGSYLDTLAAKIIVFISSPGFQQGMTTLVKAGIGVLKQLGDIILNLGKVLVDFAKVSQQTHIAEDLLSVVNAGAKLLDLILKLPTPLLTAAVGLHAFYLWGGLLATGLLTLLDPLRSVALGIGGVSTAESALAATASDASGWAKLKAVITDIGTGFGNLPSRISGTNLALKDIAAMVDTATVPGLVALQAESARTGVSLESMVPETMAAKVAALGEGLNATSKEALYMAAASGATGAELDAMAGSEALATAGTFSLSAAIKGLGASMGALLANPLTWFVLLAAGVAYATVKIFTANDATQMWINKTNQALAASSVYTVIGKNVQDLAAATTQLATAQKTGVGNAAELAAAQQDLTGKLTNELVNTGAISKAYGVDMPGALNLLQVAGVKTAALMSGPMSSAWKAALVQVAGLVQGYAAMGQGLTQLQGDVSVQLVMNADQLKQMGTLNTAWDSWLKLVTGGQTAMVGFQQQLATVITDSKAAGAAMGGLNAASLTLNGSWQTLVTNGGTVLDSIRSQSAVLENGTQGTKDLNQATKDLAAQMIPLTGGSKQAQASLLALVQEANPSITTWQALTKWVGPLGASGAAQNLAGIMTKLEVPLSDLQKDAKLLTTALQADLNPAMASAQFAAEGGQGAFNKFATELKNLGPNAQPTIQAGAQVAKILESVDGSAKAAAPQFIAWAQSMGLSKDAATKLWQEVSKGVTPSSALATGLGKSATSANDLAKSGLWAQMKDLTTQGFSQIAHFFDSQLPGFFAAIPKYSAEAWGSIWDGPKGFYQDVVKPVGDWFTQSLPHAWDVAAHAVSTGWSVSYQAFQRDFASKLTAFFTNSVPHAWDVASHAVSTGWSVSYQAFQRDFAGKLTAFFTNTVPHNWDVFSHAMSTGWGTAYNGFQRDLAGPITHWATVLLPKSIAGQAFSTAWGTAWNGFNRDVAGKIGNWFAVSLPHALGLAGQAFSTAWGTAWNGFNRDIIGNLNHFFTGTVQGYLDGAGRAWNSTWSNNWTSFVKNIWNPFSSFWTNTVQGWFDGVGRKWNSLWSNNWASFVKNIWNPFSSFFSGTVQSFFDGVGRKWNSLWSNNWASFVKNIWNPISGFFTGTFQSFFDGVGRKWNSLWSNNWASFIKNVWNPFVGIFSGGGSNSMPGQFDSVGRKWNSLWSTGWTDFVNHIINPMTGWFKNTFPAIISGAVKNGVNNAIDYLNKAIHIINDVTHIVGIPKIGDVGHVAAAGGVMPARMAAGSIPGTGDEDGTHIIAMGGEYMLRKPARMALENKFGRGYMDYLNQADTWLGSGSRGNTASQQPPHGARRMASGGNADPVGGWARPERIDQGVDYGGAGPLYAISHGTITNLYNSGWPGGAFVGLRMDQGAEAGKYWYYAEDIAPLTNIGATVQSGQHIANATGGSSGIEIGFAAPPGDGLSMASATGETKGAATATGWGVAASNFIKSLGGPGGILSGAVSGGTPGIAGGFSAIWQNILGLLDAAGGSVTGAVAALGKYVSGGAGALLNLAKSGSRALFDGVWSGGIGPIINKATPGSTSISGSFLKYSAAELKAGFETLLGIKDAGAQSSAAASNAANAAGVAGPGGGAPAANAALAQKLMPAWGSGTEWLAWNALEMAEAGWNQYARNPSSGAYGIPQALPPSKMGAAANPPQSNPTAQINWMISYIKSVYGDPIGANRHENMYHWYPSGGVVGGGGPVVLPSNAGLVGLPSSADPDVYTRQLDGPNLHLHSAAPGNATLGDMWMNSGGLQQLTGLGWAPYNLPAAEAAGGPVGYAQGDVIAAIEAATASQQIQEAMALGSYLESGWNDMAVGDAGTSFGPWQIHLPAHPGVSASEAENPSWAAKYMLPAYTTGVNQTASSLWKTNAVGAAANAAYLAERPAKTYYASQGATAVNTGWAAVLNALAAPSATVKAAAAPQAATAAPAAAASGMTPVEAWAYYSGQLGADETNEVNDFWNLQLNAPLPSTATTQQWESDYAWLLILRGQQDRLMKAWNTVNTDLGTPGNLGAFAGAADWQNVANQAATLESWTGGNIPPRSYWGDENLGAWPAGYPVGQIAPSGWASWKYQNNAWTQSKNSIDKFRTALTGAQGAWNDLYGPSGSISTSAPTPGVQTQPAGNTGPIVVDLQSLINGGPYAPVSAVSAGIPLSATGAGFSGGGEVSMADVAAMFAMGGSIPVLPARSGPQGLVSSLDRMQNGQGNARTVTSSAGDSIGVNIGNLNISNPVAERPSDTITRSSNRLAFLAGRGPL